MNFSTNIKILITVLIILTIVNLIYLDFNFLKDKKTADISLKTRSMQSDNPIDNEPACLEDCQRMINEAINNITTKTGASSVAVMKVKTKTVERESYISFGSTTSKAGDWEDLLGIEAYVDNSKYGNIKQSVFEASVVIPNGNQTAYVRLFNVTDKHPVWFSEISIAGGTPGLLISPPIKLDNGNKLYRVQMKTSLSDSVNLIQSRLKITSLVEM